MIKKLQILLVVFLLLNGIGVIAISDTNNIQNNEIKYHEKMTISFSQPSFNDENQYQTINIKEADSLLINPNKPVLPSYKHTFKFPFGAEIKNIECTPINIQELEIKKEIKYAPEPLLAGVNVLNEQNSDKSSLEEPYPNKWFDYKVGSGITNNEPCIFVKLQIFPVQYYPSKNIIKVAGDVEINIEYEETSIKSDTFKDNEEYKFIILTPPEFSSNLYPLVTHKNNRNISTKLVTLNEIYSATYFPVEGRDNPEKIKYFIKNAIENWSTRYVLLVGGSEKFPTRYTHVYVNYNDGDDEVFVTDLYYADIFNEDGEFSSWDTNENDIFGEYLWIGQTDEVDLYPDVYLGRLACIDSIELTTCVNKIINYETEEAYTKEWFNKLVVIGGDTAPHDDENINEGEYVNQAIIDIMDGFIPDKIWDSNKRLSGTYTTGVSNINEGFNNGCGFVDWSGHGDTNVWTTYPHNGSRQSLPTPWGFYLNSHVSDLENGDKLPIVITGACSVGKFNLNPKCFTWSFVSNPNGGGICSIGPNSLSWGYDTTYCIEDLGGRMQVSMFKGYKEHGAYSFGEMWVEGINEYIGGFMDGGDHKTIEQWQPFGDPTLALRGESLQPEKPNIFGPNSLTIDKQYTYEANTTDPDFDMLYYLFSWGDDTFSEWIGPVESGETVKARHTWTEKGDYEIKVLAKDDQGVQSEWSESIKISITKNKMPLFNFIMEFLDENFPRLYSMLHQI